MSTDTKTAFERAMESLHPQITPIASRQPALNPAPHHVSPAVLEFRLQQVTQERDELVACLTRTLNWLSSYPGGGTLGPNGPYEQARALLAKIGPEKG